MRCPYCEKESHPNLIVSLTEPAGVLIASGAHQLSNPGARGSWSLVLTIPPGLMGDEIRSRLGAVVTLTVTSRGSQQDLSPESSSAS